jgi:hypothetical protein
MQLQRVAILCSLGLGGVLAADGGTQRWQAVPDHRPVAAGEHPRLVFRKDQLPALRAKAETPTGRAILARMDALLADQTHWTLGHGAAYGLKYVLTGDPTHAAAARVEVDKALAGTSDRDVRYNFVKPGDGGAMRVGPSLAAVALAYDLCYDGWDADYRQKVALAIANNPNLPGIVSNPPLGPGVNHFGSSLGVGMALLAIASDSGVDERVNNSRIERLLGHAERELTQGFSQYSYYYEGTGCGRTSASGLSPFLIAARNVLGRDYVAPADSHYRWITAKYLWELAAYPAEGGYMNHQRGMYARNLPRSGMVSFSNEFAYGFLLGPAEMRPLLRWLYEEQVEPKGERTYDVIDYPSSAVFSLAGWPDEAAVSPEGRLPRVFADTDAGAYIFRSGWGDPLGDMYVSVLVGHDVSSGRGMAKGGNIQIIGRGVSFKFPGITYASMTQHLTTYADGSGILAVAMQSPTKAFDDKIHAARRILDTKGLTWLAVDYSKASGAPLVVVQVGPQAGYYVGGWTDVSKATMVVDMAGEKSGHGTRTTRLTWRGQACSITTLQAGTPPEAKLDGEVLVVGQQRFTLGEQGLSMATTVATAPSFPGSLK